MSRYRSLNRLVALGLAVWATAALVVGGFLLPASATTAAAADSPHILVSADGVHFGPTLSADLFAGIGLLIPGESEAATLWVKNPSSSPAMVRLSARDVSFSSSDFASNVTIASWNSGDGATLSHSIAQTANCEILVNSQLLQPGEVLQAVVTFRMSDVADQLAQNSAARFNVMVAMRDAEAGAFSRSACDDSGVIVGPGSSQPTNTSQAERLAQTGMNAAAPLLVIGGLIGGGILFFLIGRRRKGDAA